MSLSRTLYRPDSSKFSPMYLPNILGEISKGEPGATGPMGPMGMRGDEGENGGDAADNAVTKNCSLEGIVADFPCSYSPLPCKISSVLNLLVNYK